MSGKRKKAKENQKKTVPESVNKAPEKQQEEISAAAEMQNEAEAAAPPEPFAFVMPKDTKEPEDEIKEPALKKADSFFGSYKTVLALIIAGITFAVSAFFYLYRAGKLLFWKVDDIWNAPADKGTFYKLILPLCLIILIIGALLLSFAPYLDGIFSEVKKQLTKKLGKKETEEVFEKNNFVIQAWLKTVLLLLSGLFSTGLPFIVFIMLFIELNCLLSSKVQQYPLIIKLVVGIQGGLYIIFISLLILVKIRKKFSDANAKRLFDIGFSLINILFFGSIMFVGGYIIAKNEKQYSVIFLTEDLKNPPAEQLQAVNILFPVITTATTSTTASGTTTTDTTTTATTTVPIDMPDDVPVYVILAENKDNYLAAAGMVRQGGRLDLDRDCQIMLEKKNQIVLKKTFTEVNVDYIFDYKSEKEEEQP